MTDFMTPVQRVVEKPDLKPNCKSLVIKNSFQVIRMNHSRTLLERKQGLFHDSLQSGKDL